MTARLWYPQLDVFDTVRRIGVLLLDFESSPGTERLYIADFFLANPPLLHRTTMPMEMRRAFTELRIPKPEKSFVSYPSSPLLFHKMESIQKEAVDALLGKGLVSQEGLKYGRVELTNNGRQLFSTDVMYTADERKLSNFLAKNFAVLEEVGNSNLRNQTGLRRPI